LFCLGKFNPVDYLMLSVDWRAALEVGVHDGFVALAMAIDAKASAANPSPA
jgi:hypothetical protein